MIKRSQKKVLISARLQDVGGVEIHVMNLCQWLVRLGAQVTFASRFIRRQARPIVEELRRSSVQLVSTPFAHQGDRRSTMWATVFWRRHLSQAFDVLYTMDTTAFATLLTGYLGPRGYMIGGRAGVPRLDPAILHPATATMLDAFIVETELQAKSYHHLGIPVLAIPLMAQIGSVPKRKLRPIADRLKVVFLGRLDPNKGIYRLLDFWPGAHIEPACLHIYGDGPEREKVALRIRERGLGDSIVMKGGWFGAEQLAAILADTDLVILPSEDEGLPLVLLESMACGVPFIATDVGAVRTLATENPDVRVVPLDNNALRVALENMATAIRSGTIDPVRLQNYHHQHFGQEKVNALWSRALLEPESLIGPPKNVAGRQRYRGFSKWVNRARRGSNA